MVLAAGDDEADGGVFDDGSGSWAGSGDSAWLSGSASGAGAARLPPLKGCSVFTVDVGDRGGEGGCRGGGGDKIGGEHWSSGSIGAIISADWKGRGDGGVEDRGVDGGDVGDDVKYERGETRRLESSVLSLSSSTSQCLFLVRFAGGDFSGGDLAVGGDSAVGCGNSAVGCDSAVGWTGWTLIAWLLAVGALKGQRGRRRRRLRLCFAVVCIGKRQKSVNVLVASGVVNRHSRCMACCGADVVERHEVQY